jgi:hypothetical protein
MVRSRYDVGAHLSRSIIRGCGSFVRFNAVQCGSVRSRGGGALLCLPCVRMRDQRVRLRLSHVPSSCCACDRLAFSALECLCGTDSLRVKNQEFQDEPQEHFERAEFT